MTIHLQWFPLSAYSRLRYRRWFWATAHDSDSLFWRILGLEVTVRRR